MKIGSTRFLWAGGALLLALVVVVVLIAVDDPAEEPVANSHVAAVRRVDKLLKGIPQYGLILGAEDAPVELVEFGDMQSPVCKRYAERVLPPIIKGPVRSGEVKISFRSFAMFGPQSSSAGAAALAAGEEAHGWNYLELFYRNQRKERSADENEEFLSAVATAAGVRHMALWHKRRKLVAFEIEYNTEAVHRLGLGKPPAFAIRGPASNGLDILGRPPSTAALEAAIEKASAPGSSSASS
ncbi:MAG TPA: thioredoxin domain-containing protein [Solirubrobacterales bacterium]|nr:thioredoxin domain-containing protein [Solirubrobacterales bacterium]